MKTLAKLSFALAAGLLAAGAQASCYTVLNAKGDIVSQTSTPPVDMSRPLHDTVPVRYGKGANMVFGLADSNCGPPAEPFVQPTPVAYQVGAPAARKARSMHRRAIRHAPKADRG